MFVCEGNSHTIRKIQGGNTIVSLFAGNLSPGFAGDGGTPTAAQFNSPNGLVGDTLGRVYVSDQNNFKVGYYFQCTFLFILTVINLFRYD
jgi:hypothetical protein